MPLRVAADDAKREIFVKLRMLMTAAALSILFAGAAQAGTEVRVLISDQAESYAKFWSEVAAGYEAINPDVDIVIEFMNANDQMAKLPTMLSSDAAPHAFMTQGGGVMKTHVENGYLMDLTDFYDADDGQWRKSYSPAGVKAFTIDGRVWAVPYKFNLIHFLYNKQLFEQAGLDAKSIVTWDDFLDAVDALKGQDITPIALGAQDRWPVHFYWAMAALREGGGQAFVDAKAMIGDGFRSEPFINAGERLQELAAHNAFQRGYQAASWEASVTDFADGRAAMLLAFASTSQALAGFATDGEGIGLENVGRFAFPVIEGGAGAATETFGGNNGWVVNAKAPVETVDFLRYATNAESQAIFAALNADIPVVPGASAYISDPLLKEAAEEFENSTFHQIYLDQELGPNVGWGVVNEMVVELVTDQITPEAAATEIQDAWLLEQ